MASIRIKMMNSSMIQLLFYKLNHVWIEDMNKMSNWSNTRLISRFVKTEICDIKNGVNRTRKFRNWIETTGSELCKFIQNIVMV